MANTAKQLNKLAATLTEHQDLFGDLSVEDRQFIIKFPQHAIALMRKIIVERDKRTNFSEPWLTLMQVSGLGDTKTPGPNVLVVMEAIRRHGRHVSTDAQHMMMTIPYDGAVHNTPLIKVSNADLGRRFGCTFKETLALGEEHGL